MNIIKKKKKSYLPHLLLNSEGESEDGSSVEEATDLLKHTPSNLVALDCEMVGVGSKKQNALARCSIVDYFGRVLLDIYVKPKQTITDYRTRWSGVQPHHMDDAVPFKVARKRVLVILEGKVVVGHALHCDFKILKIRTSRVEVRDTSKNIELRRIAGFPLNETPSLRRLSQAVLGRTIQTNTHCSIEDSKAAMDLYRTVQDEWDEGTSKQKASSKYLTDTFWPPWLEKSF